MAPRLPLLWALLLAAPGCLPTEQGLGMVPSAPMSSTAYTLPHDPLKMKAPATEAEGLRVDQVGKKILVANPQLNLHPLFLTLGVPEEEVFHQDTRSVYVTEGLSRQCKSEAQLAAVLCLELGRMAVERERLASPETRLAGGQPPPDLPIGTDYHETVGGPDRTRQMELYKYDRARHRPASAPPVPSADTLARALLQKAGYAPQELDAVASLLRAAEGHVALEKQFTGRAPGPLP
jgi:hypothetical protein